KAMLKYKPFAYMFDTFSKTKLGGTGESFNWRLIRHIECLKSPVFLSGGLNERNVKAAIKSVHPDWVDACSSLEIRPGKKDAGKIRRFIKAAKNKH
ncbi:N-(5'-phosphoribosyl)anthranilate isomerase, partial [bacterium]